MQDQNKRHHPLDLNTLKGHGDSVTGLCFSSDARSLATGKKKKKKKVHTLCNFMYMCGCLFLRYILRYLSLSCGWKVCVGTLW